MGTSGREFEQLAPWRVRARSRTFGHALAVVVSAIGLLPAAVRTVPTSPSSGSGPSGSSTTSLRSRHRRHDGRVSDTDQDLSSTGSQDREDRLWRGSRLHRYARAVAARAWLLSLLCIASMFFASSTPAAARPRGFVRVDVIGGVLKITGAVRRTDRI